MFQATFTNQRGKQVSHKLNTLAMDPDKSPSCKGMDDEDKEELRSRWQQEVGHGSGE